MSGLESKLVLSSACTQLYDKAYLKWRYIMLLRGCILFEDVYCTSGGVYVPSICLHVSFCLFLFFCLLLVRRELP